VSTSDEFDDFEDDGPDDGDDLASYAGELSSAVVAFGLEPLERGTPDGDR
jgi:hypothetical protein